VSGDKTQRALVFFLVNLLALSFLKSPGTYDVGFMLSWLHTVDRLGLVAGYAELQPGYPPLSVSILWLTAKASHLLHISPFMGFKLSLLTFLLFTALALWAWTKDLLLASLLELALIPSVMALGYIDIYYAPPLVLALWALHAERPQAFAFLYGVACLVKYQPLIIGPFLAVYLLKEERYRRPGGALKIAIAALFLPLFLGGLFGTEFLVSFRRAFGHNYLSANALNFNWVLTHVLGALSASKGVPFLEALLAKPESLFRIETWHLALILKCTLVPFYLSALLAFWRRRSNFVDLVSFSLLGYLAYFTFSAGVHENHLFVACLLATVLYALDKGQRTTFLVWTMVSNINLLLFYGLAGRELPFDRVRGIDMLLAVFNVVLFVILFLQLAPPSAVFGGAGESPVPETA